MMCKFCVVLDLYMQSALQTLSHMHAVMPVHQLVYLMCAKLQECARSVFLGGCSSLRGPLSPLETIKYVVP
jgi:hypothetical protein